MISVIPYRVTFGKVTSIGYIIRVLAKNDKIRLNTFADGLIIVKNKSTLVS